MSLADLFHHETDPLVVPAGQEVFRAGEDGSVMYVVLSGTVEIRVGNEVVEEGGSGALIGEMALIGEPRRVATVVATTECRLATIDLKRFHFLVHETPHFANHVMKVMADRLRRMDQRLLDAQTARG